MERYRNPRKMTIGANLNDLGLCDGQHTCDTKAMVIMLKTEAESPLPPASCSKGDCRQESPV